MGIHLQTRLDNAKSELDNFYAQKSIQEDDKIKNLACDYLEWVGTKTNLVLNEKDFTVPEGAVIKRGYVFWTEFGYNVAEEYGGRHPSLVLRRGGDTAIVLPLSTQEPTSSQLESGIYVEIKKVYGLKPLKRWVNVLNATPVSIQRFDYSNEPANVKGFVLDEINEAMKKSGLWR